MLILIRDLFYLCISLKHDNIGVVHEDGVIEEDLELPDDPPVIRNSSLHFTEDQDTEDTEDTEDRRIQSPPTVQVYCTLYTFTVVNTKRQF